MPKPGSTCEEVPIERKLKTLLLLGVLLDGKFANAEIDSTTKKRWTNVIIAEKYGVEKRKVSGWRYKRKAIMAMDTHRHCSRQTACLSIVKNKSLKYSLVQYMRE